MVAIPKSPGVTTGPNRQTTIAAPDMASGQMIPRALMGAGAEIERAAVQLNYQQQIEEEAVNAARVVDFKTKLNKFENEQRIALSELPTNDLEAISTAKDNLLKARQTFIEDNLSQYQDNPNLSNLIKAQADSNAVDFEFDADRVLSSKKREFGQGKIYESIYNINTRLEKGGSVDAAKRDLEETIQAGLKTGLLDMQDVIREREKQKGLIREREIEFQKTYVANRIASGEIQINPADSEGRKMGELAWEIQLKNAQKSGRDVEATLDNFISTTKYIPAQVRNVWSAQLTAGTPEQKVATAENISELLSRNPRLQDQLNSDDVSYINAIKTRIGTGLSPKQIVEFTDSELSKIQSLDRQGKTKMFNEDTFKKARDSGYKALASDLADINWSLSEATVSGDIKGAYETLVKDAFLSQKYATPEAAIEYAKTQIKNTWGQTKVGKPTVMRYAPETFFPDNNSWIPAQFDSVIAQHTLSEKAKGASKDYSLAPIPNAVMNGVPSYFVVDKNGTDLLRDAQNQPVVFTPNFEKTEQYRKLQESKGRLPTKEEVKEILEGKTSNSKITEAVISGSKARFSTPYTLE